ncbi:ATP-binding protein [uncultured Prevotella sp.]|uniref:hybrid sensor histidine kinase/response regulator n=1 Tax=uncultured Prevotella sp. TaxID=159272 RepID=UPI002609CB41|nr:ATP-binding protein [uncultured Prevotella sp.]
MNYRTLRLKIITGYAILAIVLVFAAQMVYDSTRSLTALNTASERLMERRNIVDSLVYSMLDAANAERSVMMGDTRQWQRFSTSLSESQRKAMQLKQLVSDSVKAMRMDTLANLLAAKRDNAMMVLNILADASGDAVYARKVHDLQSGRDSVVIHPNEITNASNRETVYNIVSTRRGFFRRLGDAFRRQRSDTIATTMQSGRTDSTAMAQGINIADSVAVALADIHHEIKRADTRRQDAIDNRTRSLKLVSIQLAWRTGQMLEDIQSDEHNAMQRAINADMAARRATMMKIAMLALLAIGAAIVLIVYTLRDIRRQRRDHERIVEAKNETERIMQQRQRLLLTITHDIKAPVASISGFIALLREWVNQPKPVAYLDSIRSSAEHLLQLVGALLDYHQLESGKATTHAVSFNPAQLVSDCATQARPVANNKNLEVVCSLRTSADCVCQADAFRIRQIMNNLIGNAVKYTDRGTITVSAALNGTQLTMSVADTGSGMTESEQQRIFNAFTRLPDAQGKEGVGLGLSITREAVNMLGGTIRVVSQKGKGSKFTVTLPVTVDTNPSVQPATIADNSAPNVADNPAPNSADNPTPNVMNPAPDTDSPAPDMACVKSSSHPIKVVIVDDDRLQLQLLGEMMARMENISLDIHVTSSADEAIAMIGRLRPQLVFTDIEMPQMSGREMLRRIDRNGIKTVAITAHDQSIYTELRAEGFDACLFKPFNVQTLAATLCQLTGIAPSVSIPTASAYDARQDTALFAPLLVFAEGDAEAEQQIIADTRQSIADYLSMLNDPNDTASIAKAAHKAMPLLKMLMPDDVEWLADLTPERINQTDEAKRKKLYEKFKGVLEKI